MRHVAFAVDSDYHLVHQLSSLVLIVSRVIPVAADQIILRAAAGDDLRGFCFLQRPQASIPSANALIAINLVLAQNTVMSGPSAPSCGCIHFGEAATFPQAEASSCDSLLQTPLHFKLIRRVAVRIVLKIRPAWSNDPNLKPSPNPTSVAL